MPRETFTIEIQGKLIEYHQPYVHETVNGVELSDGCNWWSHPHFLKQTEARTVNDVKRWLNEHFVPAYLAVADEEVEQDEMEEEGYDEMYANNFQYLHAEVGGPLFWSDADQIFKIRKGYKGSDPILTVNVANNAARRRRGDIEPFVLLTPEMLGMASDEPTDAPIRYSILGFDTMYAEGEREFSHGRSVIVVTAIERNNETFAPLIEALPRHCQQMMNYTFRPDLEFLKHHRDPERWYLFFGMELEVSTRIPVAELQLIVTQVEPKQQPFFYIKTDSSITGRYEHRYEIVTMPCTPRRLKSEWRTLFKKLEHLCVSKGETIEDYFDMASDLTNGLHIHVSGDAFIQYGHKLSTHKNKFLSIWNGWDREFQDFLQKITKRPGSLADNRYCYPHPSFTGRTLAWRIGKGDNGQRDRHSACHDGGATCEVRVFQGVVDLHHILSCIEITQAMFEYTADAPISAFKSSAHLRFIEWVGKQNGYRYAKEALGQCV